MNDLFFLLFLSFSVLLIGWLAKPALFPESAIARLGLTRKNFGKTLGLLVGVSFLLFLITAENTPQEVDQTTQSPQPTEAREAEISQGEKTFLNYKIVYELPNYRYDGGAVYYVLVDPIDLSSDQFKSDIKAIIKQLVAQKGNKISIEFHDNRDSLELSYKMYGNLSLNRPLTPEENALKERHFVAAYQGELETGHYLNTLMFFPAAFTQSPEVGKFVEMIRFDP